MAWRAELAQFAGLLDLAQHVLEQIAFGIRIGLLEPQLVDEGYNLGKYGRLVDGEPRLGHEAHAVGVTNFGEEREHLVADPSYQLLTRHGIRPRRPPHALARHGFDASRRCVQRIADGPLAGKQARIGAAGGPGLAQIGAVDPLDHVEEEQEAQLFGIGKRVRVAAPIKVIAYLIDLAPHIRGEGHCRPLMQRFFGAGSVALGSVG
jgi:hypothetical protein